MTPYAATYMPKRAPLPMASQDFAKQPLPQAAPVGVPLADRLWRLAAFAPALAFTAMLSTGIAHWLSGEDGVTWMEAAIVFLVSFTFIWVSFSVSTVAIGLIRRVVGDCRIARTWPPQHAAPQSVALLVPIYNEVPWDVFGNAAAMLRQLSEHPTRDRYTLFILSDTRDEGVAAQEERTYHALCAAQGPQGARIAIHYRRRAENTDKKVGNLTDWIENWGARYDAMLVLDADSLMSGAAIRHLVRELAADPQAGLIQSFPTVIGAETLFGRIQQYSNAVYGWLLAEGLAAWSQREGNYWGHNAIIRTRAFADSARLPYLRGPGARRDLILSHDFVEAGMLRRAGWGVRFLPRTGGSYEETPQTLIDYALRDQRWCQGNLQHLRLLATRGFHPVSRFHLFQGAAAFLLSPAWFALIVIWTFVGQMPQTASVYFNAANPLFPAWPDSAPISGMAFLAVIYAMLLMPKVAAVCALASRARIRRLYGGGARFVASSLVEVCCSILYAPILMVQQTTAVVRALLGRRQSWSPQRRGTGGYSWAETLRFHWLETLVGLLIGTGILLGTVTPWLLPIAISLSAAVPLSKLSALRVSNGPFSPFRLDTVQSLREPRIVAAARAERARFRALLAEPEHQGPRLVLAAE